MFLSGFMVSLLLHNLSSSLWRTFCCLSSQPALSSARSACLSWSSAGGSSRCPARTRWCHPVRGNQSPPCTGSSPCGSPRCRRVSIQSRQNQIQCLWSNLSSVNEEQWLLETHQKVMRWSNVMHPLDYGETTSKTVNLAVDQELLWGFSRLQVVQTTGGGTFVCNILTVW